MKNIRNPYNLCLQGFEPWRDQLSERKIKLLANSWAGVFRKYITSTLPVEELAKHYSAHMGRPTKELTTVMGAVVLQQVFDLTDEETREQLAFNQQWHYALDSFNQDDHVLSLKTLWTCRHLLVTSGSDKNILNTVTDKLARTFDLDTSAQRLDSVHVHSNMARLGRVRLLAGVIRVFLRNLKRQNRDLYDTEISTDLKARYEDKNSSGYFGDVKPSGSKRRLGDIADDLYWLLLHFSENVDINSMYTYKAIERVFSEHCKLSGEGDIIVIPAKEIPSDSLQNPSDPDAGYDGHKGQGYQVQIMETYSDGNDDNDDGDAVELNLITHAEVEPANCHDSKALEPVLDDVSERGLSPVEALADASYGSDDNVKIAKELGVDLIAPVPGKKSDKNLGQFEFDKESLIVLKCPVGNKPDKIKHNKTGKLTAIWELDKCEKCPYSDDCPTQVRVKGRYLYYTRKEIRLLFRREYEESEEFRDKYRYRAGIEGTNSRFIQMTGARRLRYRGLNRVSFAELMKILGMNLFRVTRYIQLSGGKLAKSGNIAQNFICFCSLKLVLDFIRVKLGKFINPEKLKRNELIYT